MSTVIKVENVSKLYRLGEIGTGSMQADLKRFWHKIRGKEDPFLKIGEANDRSKKGESDYVWSLKDINFEIQHGDAVGIIGRNGAGKSTLLKLLSRVTAPTNGTIKAKGRIASLLEVGTGFHPELTGRENIFINGAFLGMRKHEIKKHLDAIIDFSGVERYIDTPVKRYSSGMYVRLAFAVAAHLESEILIVDEVLAVGDVEFQKKCLGKMDQVSKGEGRTVLFVSHNTGMINSLCNKGIVLENGLKILDSSAVEAVDYYVNNTIHSQSNVRPYVNFPYNEEHKAQILSCSIFNQLDKATNKFDVFDTPYILIEYEIKESLKSMNLCWVLNRNGESFAISFDTDFNENWFEERLPGKYIVKSTLPSPLKAGTYYLTSLSMGIANVGSFQIIEDILSFDVEENSFDPTFKSFSANRPGIMPVVHPWEIISYNH